MKILIAVFCLSLTFGAFACAGSNTTTKSSVKSGAPKASTKPIKFSKLQEFGPRI